MGKIQSEIFPFVHVDIAWFNASVAKKEKKPSARGKIRRNDEQKNLHIRSTDNYRICRLAVWEKNYADCAYGSRKDYIHTCGAASILCFAWKKSCDFM